MEQERRARSLNGLAHPVALVGGKVVENDDVALVERGHEHLLGIGEEPFAGHWSVEHHRRDHAQCRQCADEGRGLPMGPCTLWGHRFR